MKIKNIFLLTRKNYMLIRKYIYISAVIAFLAPGILIAKTEIPTEFTDFFGSAIFLIVGNVIVLFLANSLALIEENSSKGLAYLCTTPYSRKEIVVSSYFFDYIVYFSYCLIYGLSSLLFKSNLIKLDWNLFVMGLISAVLIRAVLIPISFKFGYDKAKYIITVLIIVIPFIASYLPNVIDVRNFNLMSLFNMSIKTSLLAIASLLIAELLSINVSFYIFDNKEF